MPAIPKDGIDMGKAKRIPSASMQEYNPLLGFLSIVQHIFLGLRPMMGKDSGYGFSLI
jgi:hypothetical protein